MTPGEWIAFFTVLVIVACVAGRLLIRFHPLAGGIDPLPLKTHVPVTDGAMIHSPPIHAAKEYGVCLEDGSPGIELTVKLFGGPDNGEELALPFPADTAGFIAELDKLQTFRKMKSKVFLAMAPMPHVLINRGLYVEFDNDHVAKPSAEPRIAPSPFRRRHPGSGG